MKLKDVESCDHELLLLFFGAAGPGLWVNAPGAIPGPSFSGVTPGDKAESCGTCFARRIAFERSKLGLFTPPAGHKPFKPLTMLQHRNLKLVKDLPMLEQFYKDVLDFLKAGVEARKRFGLRN